LFTRISKVQIIFFAYAILVIFFSLMPAEGINDYGFLDKIFHFAMYFLLAFLALAAFQSTWARILSLIFVYGLGFFLEWSQGFLDGRTPTIGDNLANLIGATLGIIAYFVWRNLRESRVKEPAE